MIVYPRVPSSPRPLLLTPPPTDDAPFLRGYPEVIVAAGKNLADGLLAKSVSHIERSER
jgi:hypothetical protein